jgi:uncharacterized protein YfaS (alpha-2-macroglobulin family)
MKNLYLFLGAGIIILILFPLSSCTTGQKPEEPDTVQTIIPDEFKKRIDISSSSITYYDPDSLQFETEVAYVKESDEAFTIVDYGPREQLPVEMKHPTIYVMFSQPVVPLAKLGEVMKESDVMGITPHVDGIYRWYGSRLISFEPSGKYLPQREYRVRINRNTTSLGSKKLEGSSEFSFHTEYLDIADFYPGSPYEGYSLDDVPVQAARTITISFTYPVNLDVIKQYIKITSLGKNYPFDISRLKDREGLEENYIRRTVVLTIHEPFKENSPVQITMLKGARSEADYLGRPDEVKREFHTIKPFTYVDYRTYSYSFPRSKKGDANPVYLKFSHPLDKNTVSINIDISFSVTSLDDYIAVWNTHVKLSNLPVKHGTSYVITIRKEIKDIYGRVLPNNYEVKVKVPDAESYYHFPNTGSRMLEAAFEPKIIFEYQNIVDGIWRVDSIEDPYSSFHPSTLSPYDFSRALKNRKYYRTLDLSPWLNEDKKGWVGLSWNFEPPDKKGERPKWGQRNLQVQVTDIGITTRYAYNKIIVMVSSLTTGQPIEDARVSLKAETGNVSLFNQTDRDGLAIFPLAEREYIRFFSTKTRVGRPRICVEKGTDKAEFIPNYSHDAYRFNIYTTESINRVERIKIKPYIFTDRGLYKPGETVTFGGIDRNLHLGSYTVYEGSYTFEISENSWNAKSFYHGSGKTTLQGCFTGSFNLPEDLKPGSYTIKYIRDAKTFSAAFQIAHFRRLNFAVTLEKPDITCYSGDTVSMKLHASYLSGGALHNADYQYYWTKQSTLFVPPGNKWKEYVYGPCHYEGEEHISSGSGKLNLKGDADITQTTAEGTKGLPYLFNCEARVTDIDRQVVAARNSTVVHPASFYIGTKIESGKKGYWSYFIPKGKEAKISYVLVGPDGNEYRDINNKKMQVKLSRINWKTALQQGVYGRMNYRYERVDEVEDEKEIPLTSWTGTVSFTPKECGSYYIDVEAYDNKNRSALTRLYFYSTGSSWVFWGNENPEDIKLVADKDIYTPGEKVRLLVQSPIPEGRYLLTIEREGIFEEKILHLKGSANVIEIPVKKEYLPIFYVSMTSNSKRTAAPSKSYFEPDLGKPKGFFGITGIMVSTEFTAIDIDIVPEKRIYKPGSKATVTIKASMGGKPLEGAELTFLAVDRGVLDLIDYHVPDPLRFFYNKDNFPLAVYGADSRSILIDPVTYEMKDLPGGGGKETKEGEEDTGKEAIGYIPERKDFRPTAIFSSNLVTDRKGMVTVSFTLPDTLTTYRLTGLAAKEALFGMEEKEMMVQNPINVKAALTRRLRVRDTSFAGVVLTNCDEVSHEVAVSIESDIVAIDGEQKKSINLPPNTSVEVPFKLLAVQVGEANISFTIQSDVLSEKLEEHLIIEQPLVKETFTITGKTESDPASDVSARSDEGIVIPSIIAEGYGGLLLTMDSTRLASLSEAVKYLFRYPYGCTEQRLSKLIPLILFGDTISILGLTTNVINIRETIRNELDQIARFQNSDGGIPFWLEGGRPSSPYCSIKLAHTLTLAKDNDFPIPEISINGLLDYISSLKARDISRYCIVYSLYVQTLYGRNIISKAENLFHDDKNNSLTDYCFLGLSFHANRNAKRASECLKKVKNYVKAGTRTLDLVERYTNRFYFDSDVQKLALFLMLHHRLDPSSDFVEMITTTLMKRQKYGYWVNTSDTGWALQALSDLFKNEAAEKTDFTARVTIDRNEILSTTFTGISQHSYQKSFPFSETPLTDFKKDTLLPFSFFKEGRGNLYYSASLMYALPSEVIKARDEGFSLFAEIADLDGNVQEQSDLILGKTYRMRVIISSSRRRNFVVLRVPVPSGGEILDASFVTTGTYMDAGGIDTRKIHRETIYGDEYTFSSEGIIPLYYDDYAYYAFSPIKKIMDNEVCYFFDDFYRGSQEVAFLFRLTTPGIYPTPPVYAECMYEEEVFGRTAGSIFVISQ